MRARVVTVATLLTAAVLPTAGARPVGADVYPPARAIAAALVRADAAALSLDRAVAMVQRRFDARVVRAEETREGEEVVYRIRLLAADGRVFTVRVNARTGRVD
jgi:uncharacterized membrane protein YkoI